MSRKLIRMAFENRLATLSPFWRTAIENVKFETQQGVPWQKLDLMFAETQPAGRGDDAGEVWEGICQITVFGKAQSNVTEVEARAALIRGDRGQGITGHFFRGQTLVEDGVRITVLQPYDGNPIEEPAWWGLPVKIPFVSYIF